MRPLLRNPNRRRIGLEPADPASVVITHVEAQLERDVRTSVQRVVAEHLRPHSDDTGTTSFGYWPEVLTLDLTDATLIDFNFVRCVLPSLRCVGTSFIGDVASFASATFTIRDDQSRSTCHSSGAAAPHVGERGTRGGACRG